MINPEKLCQSVDRSSYYIDVAAEPAWRTVWHASERDESVAHKAIDEMERQFTNKEFVVPGEILHVIGLRLWLSDITILKLERSQILDQARNYVQYLYDKKQLPPKNNKVFESRYLESGYGGLGLFENEKSDFREFYQHLDEMRVNVEIDLYPEQAERLLQEMESDTALFYRRINWTNDANDNIYANTPLLATTPPESFVARVLNLPSADRTRVIAALHSRYDSGYLDGVLANEREWFFAVYEEFLSSATKLTPIGQWSLSNAVRHYLSTLVPHSEEQA